MFVDVVVVMLMFLGSWVLLVLFLDVCCTWCSAMIPCLDDLMAASIDSKL